MYVRTYVYSHIYVCTYVHTYVLMHSILKYASVHIHTVILYLPALVHTYDLCRVAVALLTHVSNHFFHSSNLTYRLWVEASLLAKTRMLAKASMPWQQQIYSNYNGPQNTGAKISLFVPASLRSIVARCICVRIQPCVCACVCMCVFPKIAS